MDIAEQINEIRDVLERELKEKVRIIRWKSKNKEAEKVMDEILKLLENLTDKVEISEGKIEFPPEIDTKYMENVPILKIKNVQIYGIPTEIGFSILLESLINSKSEEKKGDIIFLIIDRCPECYEEFLLLLKEFQDFTIHVFNVKQFPMISRIFPFIRLPAVYAYVNGKLKIAWSGKNDENSIKIRRSKVFES